MTIRVLVADDQSMVRAGFRMLLAGEEDIEVVAEASNGLEAVDKAARFQPDRRADGHPHARARRARGDPAHPRRRRRRARILILTTFDLDEYIYEALRAGASGFVLKDDPPEQLIAAIRTVAARRRAALAGGDEARDQAVRAHPEPGAPEGARRADRARAGGLPPDRRAASRTPRSASELFISETTVKTHVTHVLQKLGLRDRVQAVVLAHQSGLVETESRG